jgi:ABC-type nitrate/sulfonate/bicarbonate transport system permease component
MVEARLTATPAARAPALRWTPNRVRLVTVIVALLLWEGMARSGLFYRDVVPSALAIGSAVYAEIASAAFYHHLWVTFGEVAVGFVIGALLGNAAGILLGTRPFLRAACEPYINAIGSTPKVIFLPILFLMFGIGVESKMAKGALSGFFPTVFSATAGMLMINPVLVRVGQSFNLTRWQMIWKIYLPAMINPVIVGLRLGLAIVIISVLIAELKFSQAGLGYQLAQYYESFRIAPMYAMIVIIFALAALANWGMTGLQNRANRHRNVDGRRSAAGSLSVN